MYRSSMTGLGDLLLTTPTGLLLHTSFSPPECITQAEKDEANSKCPVETVQGLGAHGSRAVAPMSGRLAYYSPCDLADLPVCPTPKCIDLWTSQFIASCIKNPNGPDCQILPPLAFYGLAQLPYCAGGNPSPPIPGCFPKEMIGLRDYCVSTKGNGPVPELNAGCWQAMHDPTYWKRVLAAPQCYDQAYVPPAPPPVIAPAPEPMPDVTPAPDKTEAGMTGMWGILALLAAAGGGYYMYRKYKR